jgi:hypothetical protein
MVGGDPAGIVHHEAAADRRAVGQRNIDAHAARLDLFDQIGQR